MAALAYVAVFGMSVLSVLIFGDKATHVFDACKTEQCRNAPAAVPVLQIGAVKK